MTSENINKHFQEGLRAVLGERKAHPWGAGVGWNAGIVHRAIQGLVPGQEFLTAIGRAENVDLNWLLTGKGVPYRTAVCTSDHEAAELVGAHLEDGGWKVYLLRSGDRAAIAMTGSGTYRLKGKDWAYTPIELVTGVLGEQTLKTLKATEHQVVKVTAEEMGAIERGEVGTWLLTKAGGIISRALPGGVSEDMIQYATMGGRAVITFSDRERRLVTRILELDEADQEAVEGLVERLGPKREGS